MDAEVLANEDAAVHERDAADDKPDAAAAPATGCPERAGVPVAALEERLGTRTLTADTVWQLQGVVYVEDGDVVTIEPCTRIEGLPASGTRPSGMPIVTRGGRLIAEGEPDKPIVFTSASAEGERRAGDWAGVMLLGRARNFEGTDVLAAALWEDERHLYGGTDDENNSGVLAYVRIEFAGFELAGSGDVDGLMLASIGRETVVHHVMVNTTLDDCFSVFGGTVEADYLICNNPGDDIFDIDGGHRGHLRHLFGRMHGVVFDHPQGIEMDGDPAMTDEPRTRTHIEHATLCGHPDDLERPGIAHGVLLRENATGSLLDIAITGFDIGLDVRGDFGSPMRPLVTLSEVRVWGQRVADIASDDEIDNTHPEPVDPDDDFGFAELEWFDLGEGNETLADPPFTADACRAPNGPADEVLESGIGAFARLGLAARGSDPLGDRMNAADIARLVAVAFACSV